MIKGSILSFFNQKNLSFEDANKRTLVVDKLVKLIAPYSDAQYPLCCLGSYARLPVVSYSEFIDLAELGILLEGINLLDQYEGRSVELFLCDFARQDYFAEWNKVDSREHYDSELTDMTSAYNLGNLEMAKLLSNYILQYLVGVKEPIHIVDIGVGSGKSILTLLACLKESSEDFSNLQLSLHLLDVDERKTEELRQQLLCYTGLNIVSVDCSLFDLNKFEANSRLFKSADIIMSGAAICHCVDKQAFFRDLYLYTKANAVFCFWDCCLPVFEKKRLRLFDEDLARRSSLFLSRVYPAQLGIRADWESKPDLKFSVDEVIGIENSCYEYCFQALKSHEGFSFVEYISWLQDRYFSEYVIPIKNRSTYHLLEAFESFSSVKRYLEQAEWKICYASYLRIPIEKFEERSFDASEMCACFLMNKQGQYEKN